MPEMPDPGAAPARSRRHLLTLAAAGGAATIASLLPDTIARGQDGEPLLLGHDNVGPRSPTGLTQTIPPDPPNESFALAIRNPAGGGALRLANGVGVGILPLFDPDTPPALLAESVEGQAVVASAAGGAPAIEAQHPVRPAIQAMGGIVGFGHLRAEDVPPGEPVGTGEGVVGQSEQPNAPAVLGESVLLINRGYDDAPPPHGIGVLGRSGTVPGVGVIGEAFANDPDYQDGTGVLGRSGSGTGVRGQSTEGAGLEGESQASFGVSGVSHSGPRVHGVSDTERAVAGASRTGPGVQGESGGGMGVIGIRVDSRPQLAEPGAGVLGSAWGDNPGVWARSASHPPSDNPPVLDGGVALKVEGKTLFSTAGAGTVLAGRNSAVVAEPLVTAASHVSVTLTGDPGGRQLRYIARDPGVGFTVHFEGGKTGARPPLPFTYLVVEPVG